MNFNHRDQDIKGQKTVEPYATDAAKLPPPPPAPTRRRGRGDEPTMEKQTTEKGTSQLVSNEKVKEMGRKARQRLEEEKSKRKEIVRLNDDDVLIASRTIIATDNKNEDNRTSQFAKAIQQSAKSKKLVRKVTRPPTKKRRTTATTKDASTVGISNNEDVDTWAPCTDGLLYYDLPKEEKSSIVRIHGLPIGTRVEDVKKFFAGLSPSHVFVLLSFDASVVGFDSCNDVSRSSKEGKRRKRSTVERHGSDLRLCVKFPSIITADVAIKRSGEFIHVDKNNHGKESIVAAAISISPISRNVAMYIESNLAIDCSKVINEGGDSTSIISHVLAEAERSIPPIVNQILWADASRVLNWKISSTKEAFQNIVHICPATTDTISEEQKQHLIHLHNHLVTIYEDLERQCSPFHFHHRAIDPCVSQMNSVSMVCQKTAELLLDRMSSIQKAIWYCKKV